MPASVRILLLGLVMAFSNASRANQCSDLFQGDGPNKPADFKTTEAFRRSLITRFELQYQDISSTRKKLVKDFFDAIDKRSSTKTGTAATNIKPIAGIPLDLNRVETIPTIAVETRDRFETAFGADPASMYSNRAFEIDLAIDALKKDPYFAWLADNRSHNLVQHEQPGSFYIQQKKVGTATNDTDPRKLFFSTIEVSGPTRLPWQLSLIRVYRDLDPSLSPELLAMAQRILELYKVEVTFHSSVFSFLGAKAERPNRPSVWDRAVSLEGAIKNLKALRTQTREIYESRFPRKSFETAKQLIAQDARELQVIGAIAKTTTERKLPPEVVEMYRGDLIKLREILRLPKDFPLEDLREVMLSMRWLLSAEPSISYEDFLVSAFLHKENSDLSHTIDSLKTVVELGRISGDESLIVQYLFREMARLNFWY